LLGAGLIQASLANADEDLPAGDVGCAMKGGGCSMTTNLSFRELALTGAAVPLPGSGQTWRRFERLADWAAADLSLGRLAEGHFDAIAVLAESGRPVVPGAAYGVWAARTAKGGTIARQDAGGWQLSGQKTFCSGNGLLDRALVTAETSDGYRLFDISVADNVVRTHPDSWPAVGMAGSLSETLDFGGPPVPEDRAIGGPEFYLKRPGFWFGAVGVAACWYGGTRGLVTHLSRSLGSHPPDSVLAELGYAVAHVEAMHDLLAHAAQAIDEDPHDTKGQASQKAMMVRHAVRHGATQVLGHAAAAGGARPLCNDHVQGQRAADLYVYLAQHHGPQDAAELGRLALETGE
jgi:alkylation response protein AidB-like acyl-CoA dehydrogenase